MEEGSLQVPVSEVSEAQRELERMARTPVISVGWLLARRRIIFFAVKASSPAIFERQSTESAVGLGEGVMVGSAIPVPVGAGARVDVGFREECFAPLPFIGRSPAW